MDVIWEDNYALVVNKPNGLLTTAARGVESLEIQLLEFFKQRSGEESPYVGMPHRIDRPVSGAVLIGKTRAATKQFCAQFQSRKIEKTYVAIVSGTPTEPTGTWRDWMRKISDRAEAEIVDAEHPEAKQAILNYELVASVGDLSCLRIGLETGRTHQIRLQAAHRGFPIVGDSLYGSQIDFGPQSTEPRKRPIALHARQIVFRHPKTGKATSVLVDVPEVWRTLGFHEVLKEGELCG
ncbi:Ribosomal large subunit pseudouridine synthase D [Rosistilla carotiformis]|uniref:Ribosomal large subunit pseudouridine synthase D n=1 Tax=Rosistilla carotiformis TaxID=2528017 RepID=A0A518JYI7_9BACT|nr:RNA pseudouridine synthase [Rosistilla carotiformis]QDV70607.1 Ribosomal large subunit pseudouridine synthase D [Rosistilla carotiformis]